MSKTMENKRSKERCGAWMPRAKEYCARFSGHTGDHYTRASMDRTKEKAAERLKDPEYRVKRLEYCKSWRRKNKEYSMQQVREYYESGQYRRWWNEKYNNDEDFRDRVSTYQHNQSVERRGIPGFDSPPKLRAYLRDRDGNSCGICGEEIVDFRGRWGPSIDHKVPLALGGPHALDNLQLAHLQCNVAKGARFIS